jgi:hypothetical protein
MKTKRAIWLVAALTLAALVPLYGDPRRSPVTHSEWARMMMRSLGFEESLERVENADDIFLSLAWKDQRNLIASKYKRSAGVVTNGDAVESAIEPGEVAYDLPIVRDGDYNVRLKLRGAPDQPFTVEIRRDGQLDSVHSFKPTGSGVEFTTVDLGWVRLNTGNHTLSVVLPPGTALDSIQISPPCLSPIEPQDGWRGPALTTDEDLARTLLQALDLESELAPADEPIFLRAGAFEVLAPDSAVSEGRDAAETQELTATPEGLHAVVYADIEKEGLYAVSVWTVEGDGQAWLADSCRRADICPSGDATPKWRTILTSDFNVGRHSFAVLLTSGAMVGQIRLQRVKASPADYVAAIKRLGFDVGPKGPITREKARAAMEWLEARWKNRRGAQQSCSIQPPLGRMTASGRLAGGLTLSPLTPSIVTPPPNPPVGPPGGGGPPLPPPVPPIGQPPATPVLPVR